MLSECLFPKMITCLSGLDPEGIPAHAGVSHPMVLALALVLALVLVLVLALAPWESHRIELMLLDLRQGQGEGVEAGVDKVLQHDLGVAVAVAADLVAHAVDPQRVAKQLV